MSVSASELEQFHRFALDRISREQDKLSLAQLVDLWELEHPTTSEQREIGEALDRATAELEVGAGRSADEVNAALRSEYGFSQ